MVGALEGHAMRRWLVTGAGGMLGRDVVSVLRLRDDVILTAADRSSLDITDSDAVAKAIDGQDVVVNCAAWTNVDGAESAEDTATAVNGHGPALLAGACAVTGARLLQVSTDYVFRGDATRPYPEDAPTGPVSAYGRGKLVGEEAVLRELPGRGYIVRTAWLYGEHGSNFVATMLKLAAQRETVDVVDDQSGQPTWSYALARRLVDLGRAVDAPPGIYHATASGQTTWFGLARAVFTAAGLDPARVRPTTSEAYVRPAPRPAYSVLGHERWGPVGLPPMARWDTELAVALSRPSFTHLIAAAARPS